MENYENEVNINPSAVMLTIYREFPQMLLDSPIDLKERDSYAKLDDLEVVFTRVAQNSGLLVFKNPLIEEIEYVPNFFVYDPSTDKGKIVDLNISRIKANEKRYSKRFVKRELGQIKKIEEMGIPTILLDREKIVEMYINEKLDIFK